MSETTTEEFQHRVLAQLEANAAELAAVKADNERLQGEVTGLRSTMLQHDGRLHAYEEPERADRTAEARNLSRGQFLRLGGAAAAGAVAAGASGLLHAGPAAAATDGPLVIGQTNHTTNTDSTLLVNGSQTVLASELLRVSNRAGSSITAPAARIAVTGLTSGADNTGQRRVGVYGQTDSAPGYGVVGRWGTSSPFPGSLGAGVLGTAEGDGIGVDARSVSGTGVRAFGDPGVDATSVSGTGVRAFGNTGVFGSGRTGVAGSSVEGHAVEGNTESGTGVMGSADSGVGVEGRAYTGICLFAAGGGRIRQQLRPAGAPTTGTFFAGEQIRDAPGELWLCVEGGAPGKWRRAATVKEGFEGGSVNFLGTPVRLFDSRTAAGPPIAPATNREVQVTGASVPAGAKGVIGNLTVVSTVNAGFLVLFATGAVPSGTASINWYASGQTLNNMAMSRLSTAGKMTIRNSSGSATHAVFDATGFVF